MLQRIHTWVPDPVLGDMNYEHEFTNESYVDVGNGMKFPTRWHSHQGWDDNSQTPEHQRRPQRIRRHDEGHQAERLPGPRRRARFRAARRVPVRVETQKLADGVYLLGGARTTASPSSSRISSRSSKPRSTSSGSLAVIEEVVKLVPNKPIRFLVNTHQHFDHLGGIRTYMHIGATIITQWLNHDVLHARCPELRAAHAAARHDLALAADRARRGLPVRDGPMKTTS